MKNSILSTIFIVAIVFNACSQPVKEEKAANISSKNKIVKSEAEWKKILTAEQYYVLREEGTERAFNNKYWDNKQTGVYHCAGCGQALFSSETKFKSGTGWPSFFKPLNRGAITEKTDYHLGYPRTEVECSRCGGHLGHVFDDGPKPTGLRYCLNSAALEFKGK